MRLRLTVEYDGAGFAGWQLQASDRTVQGTLEAAFERVTGQGVRVYGAGRTDSGVHATGQVCHLDSETRLSPEDLCRALNAVLPDDLAVRGVECVPEGFDARRDVLRKRYEYRLLNRPEPSPLRCHRTWHIRAPLDVAAMRAAALPLLGKHDFAAFRGAPGGPPPDESTIRTLEVLEICPEGDEIRLVAEGRSFLRYMVRNLAGTLVEVGRSQRPPESVAALLESRDRGRAGPTAPAQGLCLVGIVYRPD
jgi:tRNA pseudouridine38-40 synthase